MSERGQWFRQRADSLQFRIKGLSSLRRLVHLSPEQDITEHQWSVLEPQLSAASVRLIFRVKAATNRLLPQATDPANRRRLNTAFGRIEMDMARAFIFFDTYMDVLTQRRSPELSAALAGCDVLAHEAMRRDHAALEDH